MAFKVRVTNVQQVNWNAAAPQDPGARPGKFADGDPVTIVTTEVYNDTQGTAATAPTVAGPRVNTFPAGVTKADALRIIVQDYRTLRERQTPATSISTADNAVDAT